MNNYNIEDLREIVISYFPWRDHNITCEYAASIHRHRNLTYNDLPYEFHLLMVYRVLTNVDRKYPNQIPDIVFRAALCHDLLEDTGITYNDLKKVIGTAAADIVYDVTNELGKNRKERAEKTYPKIAANELAIMVKLADRIANMEYSKSTRSSMYWKYIDEYPEFRRALYKTPSTQYESIFNELWDRLDSEYQSGKA